MKKIVLIIIGFLIICLLSRCSKENKVDEIEQDRVARYIVNNIKLVDGEEIKTIDFLRFHKNTSTQTWGITVEINSRYRILLSENNIGGDIMLSSHYGGEIVIVKENQPKDFSDIKRIYYKG